MKKLTLINTLTLALFLTGCGGGDKPAVNTAAKPAEPAKTTSSTLKPEQPDAVPPSDSASVTGVASCDEYLVKLEKFMTNPNVPQATRDMYKQSLEQNRAAWKQAASTPQGKAGLETSCKMALDAIKPTLEQFAK